MSPQVTFHATAQFSTWKHRNGGAVQSNYDGKPTTKIVGPQILVDGETVEMDDFDAQWCTTMHPENFTIESSEPKIAKPASRSR